MAAGGLITGGLKAAFGFLVPAWRGAWGAWLVAGAAFGGCLATLGWAHIAWLAGTMAATIAAQGALYRLALGVGAPGPGGMQWGRVEWRLAAAQALAGALLLILASLVFVVVLASAYAVASTGAGFAASDAVTWPHAVDDRGRMVVSVIAAAGLAGLIWAAARVSLAGAATAARGRVQVLSAWPLSRGVAWRIALAQAAAGAGPAALIVLLSCAGLPLWAASLGQGLILAGLWLPLWTGLMSYLYNRLSPAPT